MIEKSNDKNSIDENDKITSKKTYCRPELRAYGALHLRTQGSTGAYGDGAVGRRPNTGKPP